MNRLAWTICALAIAAGCRNQGQYALFGKSTIPPPSLSATPPAGYAPPPAGLPGQGAPVGPPTIEIPRAVTRPPATDAPRMPLSDLSPSGLPVNPNPVASPSTAPSFASRDNFAPEEPIRIVEAAPSADSKTDSVLPFREPAPPAIVNAAPAVPFGGGSAADLSRTARPGIYAPATGVTPTGSFPTTTPATSKTRGFIPAQPAAAPSGGATIFRTDASVRPAGYIDAQPATGAWRAR
ncbi:MAG: hypothetical protein SFU86_18105 [Pirellulaceae bacterium]|nr:hypothetical protein [Pirellulaceae bacterium]